jgi:hypothetical protein
MISSTFGGGLVSEDRQLERLVGSIMRLSVYLLVPVFIAFLFGFLYYPAASCVAIRSLSARKTLNPRNVLLQIRILGFEYIKIIFISIALLSLIVASAFAIYWLISVFVSDITAMILTIATAAVVTFYSWNFLSHILVVAIRNLEQSQL